MGSKHSIVGFTLEDMAVCMRAIRGFGSGARSMEQVADRIVQYFRDEFVSPDTGARQLPLVRFYKVHEFGKLPAELSSYSKDRFACAELTSRTKCLVLLATAGEQSDWNERRLSRGHQVLPLLSVEAVQTMPMVYQAIIQLGFDVDKVINPDKHFLVSSQSDSYNVFFVAEAPGSPYIPAQEDFVKPYGVESVLGFGGMLPSGSLFVVIMFSRVKIPLQTAEIFKSLAISVKVAVIPLDGVSIFGN